MPKKLKVQSKHTLKIFEAADALNTAAAEFIIALANKSIAASERFVISLSGGQTPEKLYSLLSQSPFCEQLLWEKIFIFWGDERCVPLNDERNNAFRAKALLLDKINIPLFNVHRIPVNLSPEKAALEYEKEIRFFFKEGVPRFDLILLGLGENGHTASLFPGTKVIDEQSEGIRVVYIEKEKMFRVTMTAPLINQARDIIFLVTGEKKAEILKKIFIASYEPSKYPAQLIEPKEGNLFWFVDKKAAALTSAL